MTVSSLSLPPSIPPFLYPSPYFFSSPLPTAVTTISLPSFLLGFFFISSQLPDSTSSLSYSVILKLIIV
jgi:hypothetical protein